MIDPVLKKFGMFEASRSIHNLNDNHSFILRTPNKHLREKKSVVNS